MICVISAIKNNLASQSSATEHMIDFCTPCSQMEAAEKILRHHFSSETKIKFAKKLEKCKT
jgi:hypothetical protein